jgi:hypothetical protein
MAYVSLSRVRTLGGLRFQRNCARGLECAGCGACACQLSAADIRTSPEVRQYYRLLGQLDASASRLAEALARHGMGAEAAELPRLGSHGVAELAGRIEQRIDVEQSVRQAAHDTHACAQALNPGQPGGGGAQRFGAGVQGWWAIRPQVDSKTSRQA